jgi:septal ring factor EnvC (AmiA/AmiB activator)
MRLQSAIAVGRTPDIGPDELRLLDRSYQDWMMVDEAIAHVGDRSLTAEVMRWRGLQKCMKVAQESIRQVEDRLFAMAVDQQACRARLEEVWAVTQIEEEMRQDRRVTALTAWSVERGRLP